MFLLFIPLFIHSFIYEARDCWVNSTSTGGIKSCSPRWAGQRHRQSVSKVVNVASSCGLYSAEYRPSSSAPVWLIFAAHGTTDWCHHTLICITIHNTCLVFSSNFWSVFVISMRDCTSHQPQTRGDATGARAMSLTVTHFLSPPCLGCSQSCSGGK